MSGSEYTWVVIGEASRLPVAAFDRKHMLIRWLRIRRGHSMLRVFRINPTYPNQVTFGFKVVELSIEELLEPPRAGKEQR